MILGVIKTFAKDLLSKKQTITFEVEGDFTDMLEKLKDEKIVLEFRKYNPKRSLTSNSYYWSLVHKISEIYKVPDAYTHNLYLRDCNCLEMIGGQTIAVTVPDTDEAEEEVLRRSDMHLKPTHKTIKGKDGKQLRYYLLLRGSSDFDSAEMSRLIDFVVHDCKANGIPTLSDNETQRLLEQHGLKGD